MRDPGKKILPVWFNSYRWHVFHKFTSVQEKSSYKASWKGRKYFQKYLYFFCRYWHQCSDLGMLLYNCCFYLQIEIRENWRSHVIIKNVSDFTEITSAKLRAEASKIFWNNSLFFAWFSMCLPGARCYQLRKDSSHWWLLWLGKHCPGSQGYASSALLLLWSGCEHGFLLR